MLALEPKNVIARLQDNETARQQDQTRHKLPAQQIDKTRHRLSTQHWRDKTKAKTETKARDTRSPKPN